MIINKFKKQIDETYRRFEKFYEPGDFVFGFITDVHTGGNTHYKHYKYFLDAAKKFNASLMINGGDIGLGVSEDKKESDSILKNTVKNSKTNLSYIYIKGNHDCGTQNISNKELYKVMMDKYIGKVYKSVSLNDEIGSGIYLNHSSKIALLFINTSQTAEPTYIVKNDQIHWLIDTLTDIQNDYRVILVSHLCMDKIGVWKKSYVNNDFSFPKSIELVQKIIYDFVNKSSGDVTYLNERFSWDFKNKKNRFLFELAGDSHFDNYINRKGLNIIVRQGYGGILPENIADGGTHTPFSANDGFKNIENCLFDFICIKPNNKFRIFRVGVGDNKADLEF
ncbi:MAG: metallophosphoesterase [Bacilli bacterium]|nr:metallophosphoesterase [Bacilli bacterium]